MVCLKKNGLVLCGIGHEGMETFFQCERRGIIFDYIIDRNQEGQFRNVPIIHSIDELPSRNYFIVIGTIYTTYVEISKELKNKGLREFVDYVWGKSLFKQIVGINANCHGEAVVKFFSNSLEFDSMYCIYPIPQIHLNDEGRINSDLLKLLDVYIHQDIRAHNSYGYKLSDEYVLPLLSEDCKSICIPNMVGLGSLVHQWQRGQVPIPEKGVRFFYRDAFCDWIYEHSDKKRLQSVLMAMSDFPLNEAEIKANYNNIWNKIVQREKNWDIKVCSFIQENIQQYPMFNDMDHPSSFLLNYICKELGHMLGIHDLDDRVFDLEIGAQSFVWPMMYKCFSLANLDKVGGQYGMPLMTMDEYVRKYVWLVHGTMLI